MAKEYIQPRIGVMLLAIAYLLCAALISSAGMAVLVDWEAVSASLAAIGVIVLLCSLVLFACGAWLIASLGWHRIPLWMSGGATSIAGTIWVGGVLANVIPCSGPA